MMYALFINLLIATAVTATIYFKEDFNDAAWEKRWVVPSDWKPASELGPWLWTAGDYFADANNKAIKTGEDYRHYGLSAKLDKPFTNKDKELVIQFSVKHEQDLDCGGAYIKLLGDIDQKKFGGDSPYQIMFGPDICGPSNRKTHVIFNYPPKNDNLLIKNEVKVETDRQKHLYTLIVKPDKTFEVLIDQESVKSGKLDEEWDFLLPKTIKDPSISKPVDWVDKKKIPDPADKKPEGYDDIPAEIPDKDATKPEDWDDEEDGAWEAPLIDNPAYKGPWKPKMIANPEYKGEWVHPEIPNPDFKEDADLAVRCKDCTHIGFELWQVKAGTVFDDILVTDSAAEAKEIADKTFGAWKEAEKAAFDLFEKEKNAEAAAAAGSSSDNNKEAAKDEEDDEHDEL